MTHDAADGGTPVAPGQSWTVDALRPEDAEGVRDLFISVYGRDYPIRVYLEPAALIAENAAGNILSSVARTPTGDIVGHNAIFRSAPFPGIFELGAGLVHADYRGGQGAFSRMIDHCNRRGAETPGVETIYGEPVCNHIFTQKAVFKMGWRTMALEVDLMPASAYATEESAPGRVSVLFDAWTVRPRPHTVHVPDAYREALTEIYDGLDDERTVEAADAPLPTAQATRIRPTVFDFAQAARLTVDSAGADFAEALRSQETALRRDGVQVLQLWLNLAWPWVGAAAAAARVQGYFLGGVLPRWYDSDGLLLQKTVERPHWEDIQLFSDAARRVVDRVRQDWEAVSEEQARLVTLDTHAEQERADL